MIIGNNKSPSSSSSSSSSIMGCCNFRTKYILTILAAFALITSSKVAAAAYQSALLLCSGKTSNVLLGTNYRQKSSGHYHPCHHNSFGYTMSSTSLNAATTTMSLSSPRMLQSSSLFRKLNSRYGHESNGYEQNNHERKLSTTGNGRRRRSQSRAVGALQSSTMPHADIAVRLDQPILSPTQSNFQKSASTILKSILTIFLSDIAKTALIAFFLAFTLTFLSKSSTLSKNIINPTFSSIKHVFKLIQGQIQKVKEGVISNNEKEGIPMTFGNDNDGNVSWGVCTLLSKKKMGRSKYMQYEFKLPSEENILNLALGQKVSLCCLDDEDRVAKKDYYLFSPKSKKGSFSILASADGFEDDDVMLAKGEGDFRKVLADELSIGDEVALQPGPRTLSYKGEYLPVTDMVYIASGSGIAPVLDQVKAVLPSGSSSVQSVSVIWLNEKEEDFDVALSSLEDEYFKYSTKLAVSCVVDEKNGKKIAQNREVDEALPPFKPGTMAVIAGPKRFGNDARSMLMGYGYPEECICVLP